MNTEFGVFAERSKEHWEKMSEYCKEMKKMSEEFPKDLPTWLVRHDKSWVNHR